jgi:hypothetical protein
MIFMFTLLPIFPAFIGCTPFFRRLFNLITMKFFLSWNPLKLRHTLYWCV